MTKQHHSAALETASKRVNDFIAILAHELRNPLAPIRNAARLLEQVKPQDESFPMLCRAIDRQSAQLSRIVDDLLDISRVTRGKLDLQKSDVDIVEVVTRALEAAQPGIDAAGHKLEVDMPSSEVYVDGDAMRLTQALTNVLNNAARYTDPGGRISVKAWIREAEGARQVVISVRDNGRGIDPDLLGAIFEMFVQGHDYVDRAGTGLGVGLALARSIVELHHGRIEARSEGLGHGAEFLVSLPLKAEVWPPARQPSSSRPAQSHVRRRVLVVDDNADAAAMLAAILRHLGSEVHVAHSGIEALREAELLRPDVILLDIGMPGMNGFEVARRLRAQRPERQPLIIAVTGWGKPDDEARSREAGFDLHLVKPVEGYQLERILAKRSMH